MSREDTPQGFQEQGENKGWSTKKKWVVGCGGCLGVIVLIGLALAVMAGLWINNAKNISDEAVGKIFGPSYKPANYLAMGLPVNSQNIQTMALLISKEKGSMIGAAQTKLPADQADFIRTGKIQQLQTLLKKMAEDAANSSHNRGASQFKSVRFDQMYNLNLAPNKMYTVCNATVEVNRRGILTYMPTSVALLPQSNNGLVVLATFDPNNTSTEADTNFDSLQKGMQEQVLQVIKDSDLDDSLSVSGAPAKPLKQAAKP